MWTFSNRTFWWFRRWQKDHGLSGMERYWKSLWYIYQKNKVPELKAKTHNTGVLVDEVTDFNNMMSELLESMDKVDKSVKKNNIQDKDFPLL